MAGRPGPQSVWWALFSLQGRIRRATYLLGGVFIVSLWWVALAQVFSLREASEQHGTWLIILGTIVLATGYCGYALAHKRLHDLGYPGPFALVLIVFSVFMPFLAVIAFGVFAVIPGEEKPNKFGPPPVS